MNMFTIKTKAGELPFAELMSSKSSLWYCRPNEKYYQSELALQSVGAFVESLDATTALAQEKSKENGKGMHNTNDVQVDAIVCPSRSCPCKFLAQSHPNNVPCALPCVVDCPPMIEKVVIHRQELHKKISHIEKVRLSLWSKRRIRRVTQIIEKEAVNRNANLLNARWNVTQTRTIRRACGCVQAQMRKISMDSSTFTTSHQCSKCQLPQRQIVHNELALSHQAKRQRLDIAKDFTGSAPSASDSFSSSDGNSGSDGDCFPKQFSEGATSSGAQSSSTSARSSASLSGENSCGYSSGSQHRKRNREANSVASRNARFLLDPLIEPTDNVLRLQSRNNITCDAKSSQMGMAKENLMSKETAQEEASENNRAGDEGMNSGKARSTRASMKVGTLAPVGTVKQKSLSGSSSDDSESRIAEWSQAVKCTEFAGMFNMHGAGVEYHFVYTRYISRSTRQVIKLGRAFVCLYEELQTDPKFIIDVVSLPNEQATSLEHFVRNLAAVDYIDRFVNKHTKWTKLHLNTIRGNLNKMRTSLFSQDVKQMKSNYLAAEEEIFQIMHKVSLGTHKLKSQLRIIQTPY